LEETASTVLQYNYQSNPYPIHFIKFPENPDPIQPSPILGWIIFMSNPDAQRHVGPKTCFLFYFTGLQYKPIDIKFISLSSSLYFVLDTGNLVVSS